MCAFHHSPQIVTDGLVLLLDAANTKSYPGSGTSWNDLSGGENNGTLSAEAIGTTTGATMIFNGTSDYITVSSSNMNINKGTVSTWVKRTDGDVVYIWDARLSDNNALLIYFTDTTMYVYSGTSIITTTSPIINTWTCVDLTYDYDINNFILYKNGINDGSSTDSKSAVTWGDFYIGARHSDSNWYWKGQIPVVKIYNKVLTQSEILQNYNALKGRFSL